MLSRVTLIAIVFCCGVSGWSHAAEPLAGTQPLTWEGDLSVRMVDDLHKFADRETAASIERRARHWQRDFTSPEAYDKSVAANRTRLAKYLGVKYPPPPETVARVVEPPREAGFAAMSPAVSLLGDEEMTLGIPFRFVRWPVHVDVWGYGFQARPKGTIKATAIFVLDEQFEYELGTRRQSILDVATSLYAAGCEVFFVPIIDRSNAQSFVALGAKQTNQTHREFIHRQAFEMGRSALGYDVDTVRGLLNSRIGTEKQPIAVLGTGVGGRVALLTGALDPRVDVTGVCGAFGPQETLFERPLDHDIWGFLDEFGDAELASLVVPRHLIVDVATGGKYRGKELQPTKVHGAAPGTLVVPTSEQAHAEIERALKLAPVQREWKLGAIVDGLTADAGTMSFSSEVAQRLGLSPATLETAAPPEAGIWKGFWNALQEADRFAEAYETAQAETVRQWIEHTQALMRESEFVRKEWWKDADRKSRDPAKWQASLTGYKHYFYNEVLGRFEYDLLPPNARTRLIYDTPKYRGYDVVLDVFGVAEKETGKDEAAGGVWALGTLLVPKDLMPGEKRPVVVCQHGLEGKPEDTILPNLKGSNYYHMFAARLAERGFVVFSPQNPYIGKDHFRQLVRKLHPLKKTLWSVIVPQQQQITDWLASLEFVDPTRIGFYGLSYGGKTAMRVPALVDNYCLSICSGDFNEWIRKCTSVREPFSYMGTHEYEMFEFDLGHTFNYAEMAYLIAPRPFMVERGHRDGVGVDEWVSYEYAKVRMLYADLKIPERTEIEYFDGPHEIHAVGTFDFLHRHLNWPAKE
ncbi:MAG: hypothetical protein C0483_07710 [Pirellula sp.]|nr:hypothetical protein [Pirellula sp.]